MDLIIVCVFRPEEVDCYEFLMPLYFPTDPAIELGGPGQVEPAWVPRIVPPKELKKKDEENEEPRSHEDEEPNSHADEEQQRPNEDEEEEKTLENAKKPQEDLQ